MTTVCRDVKPWNEATQLKYPLKYEFARRTVNPTRRSNIKLSSSTGTGRDDFISVTLMSGRVGRHGSLPGKPDVKRRYERRRSTSKRCPSDSAQIKCLFTMGYWHYVLCTFSLDSIIAYWFYEFLCSVYVSHSGWSRTFIKGMWNVWGTEVPQRDPGGPSPGGVWGRSPRS